MGKSKMIRIISLMKKTCSLQECQPGNFPLVQVQCSNSPKDKWLGRSQLTAELVILRWTVSKRNIGLAASMMILMRKWEVKEIQKIQIDWLSRMNIQGVNKK